MKPADVTSLRMLRRARDRIDRDYAEPIGIPALAAGAGYSREHFIRAFRAAYGETPTSDCQADHDLLAGRGVDFTQPPAERPYGVEAIMRDDSRNWYSFTQRTA